MTMASLTHEIPNKDIQLLDFFFWCSVNFESQIRVSRSAENQLS